MKRRITLIALALVLLLPQAAFAASSPLVIRDVGLEQFPRVSMQLSLPSSLMGSGSATPKFLVQENGKGVEVIDTSQPKVDPVDVVLVVDTSGSMKGKSIDSAKGAAKAFVDELEEGSKVSVISFSDKPRLVSPMSEPLPGLSGEVDSLEAKGETAMYDALSMAAREVTRAQVKRPVVVLLSDGGDTVSRVQLDTPVKALKSAGAPVLVVALPSAESDYGSLRTIAKQTGGRFATVGSADDLLAFYTDLAKELQTTWNITYVSRRPSTADLDVEVTAKTASGKATGSQLMPNPLFASAPAQTSAVLPAPPANTVTLMAAIGLVFVAVFAMVAALVLMLVRPKTALDQLKYYDQMNADTDTDLSEGRFDGITSSVLGAVDYVAGKRGIKRLAYEQLERAGLPLRPVEYITAHTLGVVIVGVLVQVISQNLLLSIVAVIVATMGPLAYLDRKIVKRKRAFQDQLPDILNLMAGSLRAGWGLQQSLNLVVEQSAEPVKSEFSRAETETRLGRPVEEALGSVAERMQSDDFAWAVTAIGIQRDVGGNLAEVLDVVAATIRDRGALHRQIDALTAEGKLSAWVLILLPFVLILLLMVVNPGYLNKLFTTAPGLAMAFIGFVLLVVGIFWLRRVVTIEV